LAITEAMIFHFLGLTSMTNGNSEETMGGRSYREQKSRRLQLVVGRKGTASERRMLARIANRSQSARGSISCTRTVIMVARQIDD
jgi:hypothetical protein